MNVNLQRWYEVAGVVPLAAAVFFCGSLFSAFPRFPPEVPVHFDLDGTAGGWLPKYAWLVVAPSVAASVVALVFTTRPVPICVPSFLYWFASGLVIGALVQINKAALSNAPLQFRPILIWSLLIPCSELPLVLATKHWWSSSPR